MYIQRKIEVDLQEWLKHFPAIALLGPRQAGKTTTVKEMFPEDDTVIYLDLENPSDRAVLDHPAEFFASVPGKKIIIDEIQREPGLFPVLRSVIDKNRAAGRFILLGSASRDLLLLSNESLAGRIIYAELTPFMLSEITNIAGFRDHWLKGGYPEPFLQSENSVRITWMRSFITTYVERDLRTLGLGTSASDTRRLLYMLSNVHGSQLNLNNLGNSLGINAQIVKKIISFFEKSFIIRLLPPYSGNIGKRLVKSPKIYFRDSGMVNFLMNLKTYEEMLMHPMLGNLWEGYVVENMINMLGDNYQYYYYRTADGAECDLVIFEGMRCVAVIDAKFSPAPSRTRSMTTAMNDLNPQHSFFIIPDCKVPYALGDQLTVATIEQVLALIKMN